METAPTVDSDTGVPEPFHGPKANGSVDSLHANF